MLSALHIICSVLGGDLVASLPVALHELEETSATAIVRDGGHMELRLSVRWSMVLWRHLKPRGTIEEVLTHAIAQSPAAFAAEVRAIERVVELGARVDAGESALRSFERWSWPRPDEIQRALKQELMSRLVDGTAYHAASRLPAQAQVRLGPAAARSRVRFPPVLGPVLLTVTVPRTSWLQAGQWSAPILDS